MSEIERIGDQLHRAFYGEAWSGPALWELLAGVDFPTAAARPVAGAHSILEIVLHAAVWKRVVVERLRGQDPRPTGEKDWPSAGNVSEAAWHKAKAELENAHRQLEQSVAALREERLADVVPGHDYNFYVMLQGAAQHDLYHGGQIALLKKGK